ncbi:MMPL family transporter [Shewanella surugensis]|uniref:MMPL family transporter n=1 Tax=Shewanella surugensis TaxID=212020 RepID=A0ABT0LAD2_9GAMM|nr:MMPL family transporter [Shewanella surugensis]MCL1124595.1 MMPL family transporter [Shewanella surugensis]
MIKHIAQWVSDIKPSLRFLLWVTILISLAFTGLHLWQHGAKVQTDILAMLPKVKEDPLTDRALSRVESQLANRIYIALIASNETEAVSAAKRFMDSLEQTSPAAFDDIQSADLNQGEALSQYYFPYRFKLLTQKQTQALSQDQLPQMILSTQQALYNAFNFANSRLLTQDPLLLYPDNIMAMVPKNQLQVQQGILLHKQNGHVASIVMAKGINSAFNPDAQQAQLASLDNAIQVTTHQYQNIKIIKAGALFHAAAATETAKNEISTIGIISLVGVIALVWFAFRSIMPLLIALLTLTTGFLFALIGTLLVFNQIHLLTLVFGTSLIGIAIDYSFHFYCERLQHQTLSASNTVKHIFPAISLALLTSVLAYLSMGLAPFPGMQQVAIFCASGLIGAYLTLILAYPLLAQSPLPTSKKQLVLATQYQTMLTRFSHGLSHQQLTISLIILFAFCSYGLLHLKSNDDIRQLQQSPVQITQEENQVRSLLSGGTDNQFLLVKGANEQALLQHLESLTPYLQKAISLGYLGNAISISPYLPSHKQQDESYQLQEKIYGKSLHSILDDIGLDDSIAPALQNAYLNARSQYIEPDGFLTSAGGKSLSPLWLAPTAKVSSEVKLTQTKLAQTKLTPIALNQTNEFGTIVLLGGIHNLPALTQLLMPLIHNNGPVKLVDKVADISHIMGQYRQLTLALLAIALILACFIFSIRFHFKLALIIVAVPTLATLFTLAILGVVGSALTLFHALALILVFGIGVDYSLFFAEAQKDSAGVMMAVFMSACSTLLAFGLLAFSNTPAIHTFGLTLLLGIGFTFLLSPFIHVVTKGKP